MTNKANRAIREKGYCRMQKFKVATFRNPEATPNKLLHSGQDKMAIKAIMSYSPYCLYAVVALLPLCL
ncbi:MAG: hypothetical protein ISS47_10120 [Candidatus Omnitrophica bacterium]|nr:hypothetical protein [Candidatus Omnitrophota bacterium]